MTDHPLEQPSEEAMEGLRRGLLVAAHEHLCDHTGDDQDTIDAANRLWGEIESLRTKIATLRERVRVAEEIVARLPKTADGVRVAPGMHLYSLIGRSEREIGLGVAWMYESNEWPEDGEQERTFLQNYSTRDAALSARKKVER